jgi:large subunit ribosomal protein L15
MQLHELTPPRGSKKKKKIVGRGPGSGVGKTSGRGNKGQTSRTGTWAVQGSEGGQSRLIRRLPKVGFRSHRPVLNQVVNVESLNKFEKGVVVNAESLKALKLISSLNKPVKILAVGEVKKPLTVQVYSISKAAKDKIEKAGGKVEIIIWDAEQKESSGK